MTALTSLSHSTRRGFRALALALATTSACLLSAGVSVAAPLAPPTPLGATASAAPEIQAPVGEPQKLVPVPATAGAAGAAGAAGPSVARGEGKVAAGRPAAFVFQTEVAGLYSIGVSSPQSAARLTIFLGRSDQPAASTSVADGAIRWSTELGAGEKVRIVIHTAGAEIPFRVEATGGPGGL